jgi:hypothetical protein
VNKTLRKPTGAAIGAVLIAAFAFGGVVLAHNLPTTLTDQASPTATVKADETAEPSETPDPTDTANPTGATSLNAPTNTNDNHGATVSVVAQDNTLVGGPHQNHGYYVSCVARGGAMPTAAPSQTPDPSATCIPATPPPTSGTSTDTSTAPGNSGNHGNHGNSGTHHHGRPF